MPLPQKTPGQGGERKREHFSHAPTPANSAFHAYSAGPTMWFECHTPKKTKPCIAILTDREVECPWCTPDFPVATKGYVPIYRASDWAPRCVIVGETFREVCDGLKLHTRVTIGKEGEDTDPVWIVRALEQRPVFASTLAHRFRPVDLTDSLLKLWGNEALKKWWAENSSRFAADVSDKPGAVAVTDSGQVVSPMLQAAAQKHGMNTSDAPADVSKHRNQVQELLNHVGQGGPSDNGNGKKKK